jgi:hypothetical protein
MSGDSGTRSRILSMRRISNRPKYPSLEFDGTTPSVKRKFSARAWSSRIAVSSGGNVCRSSWYGSPNTDS